MSQSETRCLPMLQHGWMQGCRFLKFLIVVFMQVDWQGLSTKRQRIEDG
jgi:hypothetical protein